MLILFSGVFSQGAESSGINNIPFIVYVFDASSKVPLQSSKVTLKREGVLIENEESNVMGKAVFQDIVPGTYNLTVYLSGYDFYSATIYVEESNIEYSVGLKEYTTKEIDVIAEHELTVTSIDNTSGNQFFESEAYHGAPSARMTNIIQENLLGAVRAPTGEVHISGMHGEFTYYIDGLPVPLGVFGGLNEVVDPKVLDRINFYTGGFPAEYGGQMAAIMDVHTLVPKGKLHLDFSTYAGSYLVFNGTKPFSPGTEVTSGQSSNAASDTLGGRVGPFRSINSNGQSLSLSDNIDKLGFFISSSRQETDRRIDQPTATLFNDRGTDYYLYGKFDYRISKSDYITANLNYSKTITQVPFDINEQGYSPDNQTTSNSFENISWFHSISTNKDRLSNFFAGFFFRQGSLLYTPGPESPTTFQFAGDSTLYALTEDRSFNTYGMKTKYDFRLSNSFMSYIGINFSATDGKEHFTSRDSAGNAGPNVLINFKGSDFGAFAQSEWRPIRLLKLDLGLRYDQHIAPDVQMERQVSPRIKLNFFFNESNSAYLYYGKHFMPNNIEGIRQLASNVTNSGVPTLSAREDFYESAFVKTFPFGLIAKLDFFHIYASPGVDDQTIGSSAVKTPVNIATIKTTGLGIALSYNHPKVPISGYLNVSIIHAYGSGTVTGGFLTITNDGPATDLDHDQRLSIVGGINYQPGNWFINLTSIYGSGLTNGNPNNVPYQTGLFDFNKDAHVPPSIIFNLGAGYTFHLKGAMTAEPSIYITNILDNSYLLKGAYFSAASYGERRNVILKLALHI
ncbi:MAG: hypothetical protein ABSF32_07260 [Ignavibacteria bacterium]|jgi:hypothetical protein